MKKQKKRSIADDDDSVQINVDNRNTNGHRIHKRRRSNVVDYSLSSRSKNHNNSQPSTSKTNTTIASSSSEILENTNNLSIEDKRKLAIESTINEMAELTENYDDKVRQLFYLEKFVSLAFYDPEVEKLNNSEVFQQVCKLLSLSICFHSFVHS